MATPLLFFLVIYLISANITMEVKKGHRSPQLTIYGNGSDFDSTCVFQCTTQSDYGLLYLDKGVPADEAARLLAGVAARFQTDVKFNEQLVEDGRAEIEKQLRRDYMDNDMFRQLFIMHLHPSTSTAHSSLWIFGYGSLIWNPGFSYAERRKAHARGYARRMYQGNTYHRGDDTLPGRVATLVESPTEDANGVVFRVEGTRAIEAALKHLNEREIGNGYIFKLVRISLDVSELEPKRGGSESTDGSTTSYSDSEEEERREGPDYHNSFLALTCIAHSSNELFLGPAHPAEMAAQIGAASGRAGPNHEYVLKLAENIRALFPRTEDRHLFGLEKRVREIVKRERRDTV